MRFRFSIRLKIFTLLAAALLVTLFSALYIATQLMIRDKTSYLYEANLMTAREVLRELGSRVGEVQIGLRGLAAPGMSDAELNDRVARLVAEDGVKGVWIAGKAPRGLGPEARAAEGVDRRLGWDWGASAGSPTG